MVIGMVFSGVSVSSDWQGTPSFLLLDEGVGSGLSDWDVGLVERLLGESYRCVMKKDGALVRALLIASGLSEEDIRQECYLRGFEVMPYACGSWSERVNYVYSVMINRLRDLSRRWQRRSAAGQDSVQVGSLDLYRELGMESGVAGTGEGLVDYLMSKELEGLRRRVIYLERLISLDLDMRERYWRWLSGEGSSDT